MLTPWVWAEEEEGPRGRRIKLGEALVIIASMLFGWQAAEAAAHHVPAGLVFVMVCGHAVVAFEPNDKGGFTRYTGKDLLALRHTRGHVVAHLFDVSKAPMVEIDCNPDPDPKRKKDANHQA